MGAQQRGRAFTLSALPGADLRGEGTHARTQACRLALVWSGQGSQAAGKVAKVGEATVTVPALLGQGSVGKEGRSWPLRLHCGPVARSMLL